MKFVLFTILFILTCNFTIGQDLNTIANQIDSLKSLDQKARHEFTIATNNNSDSLTFKNISLSIRIRDSLNYIIVKNIFSRHGYLGLNKVSKETSHNFWLLVQHADKHPDFQKSVLDSMKTEIIRKNASEIDYAYLVDRVNINNGEMQLYGTQLVLNENQTSYTVKPTFDLINLNKRRQQIGLTSIEEYIKEMNEHMKGTLKK